MRIKRLFHRTEITIRLMSTCGMLFLIACTSIAASCSRTLTEVTIMLSGVRTRGHTPLRLTTTTRIPRARTILPLHSIFCHTGETIPLTRTTNGVYNRRIDFCPPKVPILLPNRLMARRVVTCYHTRGRLKLPMDKPTSDGLGAVHIVTS